MSSLLGGYADLLIAGGLVVIAVVVFLVSRMGLLPKRSLPIVAGALVGVFGVTVLRERRARILRERLRELEEELVKREKVLEDLRESSLASEAQLRKAQAELSAQRVALQQSILQVAAATGAERERIDRMDANEVADEFVRRFGGDSAPAGTSVVSPVAVAPAPPAVPVGTPLAGGRSGR